MAMGKEGKKRTRRKETAYDLQYVQLERLFTNNYITETITTPKAKKKARNIFREKTKMVIKPVKPQHKPHSKINYCTETYL